MLPYARAELPLVIHADEVPPDQIRRRMGRDEQIQNRHRRRPRCVDAAPRLLASNNIPVIYEDMFTQPVRDTESYDVHFHAPEILRAAGVNVIFTTGPGGFDAPWLAIFLT